MVRLTIETAEHSREVETDEAVVTIGRASRNTLRIADDQSSREHCRLERHDDGSWTLVDLASRNGTHLNDKLVDEAPLHQGDRVRIGSTTITLELPGSEQEAAEEPAEHDAHHEAPRAIRLSFSEGPQKGRSVVVFEKLTTLGRRATSDIVLTDTGASNRHAEIRRGPDGFVLVDSGSRNGTFLNGRLILRNPLVPGDVIRIGKTAIRAEAASADEETAAQIAIESEGVVRDDSGFITAEDYPPETSSWSRAVGALLAATLAAAVLAYLFRGHIATWVSTSPRQAPDLLDGRGSFDDRAAWAPTADSDGSVERGVLAIRLPARGPSGTLAAFDCSEALAIDRGKRYVVSGRARTDEMGTGLAGILVTWRGKGGWEPSTSQLLRPAASADSLWATVEQRLIPPPWAERLHVSCVAQAPSGIARFDDVRVTDPHGTEELPRLASDPLRLAADTPVLFSLIHDETLVTAGAGLVVEPGQGAAPLRPVTARVADGSRRGADGRYQARSTARLLPHGVELTIEQSLSQVAGGLRLEWRLAASKPVAVAFAGIELPCAAARIRAGVDVRTSGGFTSSGRDEAELAFDDAYGLTLSLDAGKLFIACDEPLVVQGRAAGARGILRLGLRDAALETRPLRLALTLRGTSAEDERRLVGDLLAAGRAAQARQYGDALARYEELLRLHPHRRDVAERGRRQLDELGREARQHAEAALRLMARAELTGAQADFEAAHAALAPLRKGLKGTRHEAAVAKALAQCADLRSGAERQRLERDAARLLGGAEELRGTNQMHTARLYCQEVLARCPRTAAAAQARALLDALDAPAPPKTTQPE